MYETSKKWEQNIYENPVCAMNIYIDDVLINPDYILDFKKGGNAFEEEFCLGGTPSQYIEMKLYKDKIPLTPSKIKVEYGILISHSLTVTEVNAMLVGTLNGIPVKSLSSNNSSFEMIPIGIYNVDDYTDNDDNTITIKALDNMIKFEFNYNGKELIDKKNEATLLEVAQDICNKAGVELGSTSFLNSDKKVSVYDNTVTAREYISYIAESAGCFACIDREGKLCFREFGQDETEISLEMFGEYKWGEEFKISKVSYEDGVRSFKFGDDTRNNLWINQENMYIVDEDQVQKIYNKIKDLTVNTFEGKVIIDPAIDIGDKIVINGKNVFYQGEMSLEGSFIAQISSKIQIKQKEETTVKKESQKVVNRRVQSRIDQAEGKIEQLVEETTENTKNIAKQEISINGITQEVSKKVDETKLGTAIEQNYEHVKVAWNQISDFIQMMIINKNASLAILDKDKNVMMALDKNGQHFYKSDGNTVFGEMGVQTVDKQNYISFAVPTDYGKSVEDGMAWGVITSSDDKFWPIMYIKNFTMPPKNSEGCTGEMVLDRCDLVLNSANAGIVATNIKMHGDAMPGLYIDDTSTGQLLLSIIPQIGNIYPSISILDKISFYVDLAGSHTLRIGEENCNCTLSDDGFIVCRRLHVEGNITATGEVISNSSIKVKKNIERYQSRALDEILKTDIYMFNYKSEEKSKKTIGTIIGDGYNCSKEIISSNKEGINLYSMVSIAYKAIQELQDEIEKLQAKDKEKDNIIQSLIKRIETLEKGVNK
jgi:hypothetical protein|nr:MAG TPA: Receptor recognition protein, Long tail, Helical sandwich, Tail fiber [Caudoviricetes sp.]